MIGVARPFETERRYRALSAVVVIDSDLAFTIIARSPVVLNRNCLP